MYQLMNKDVVVATVEERVVYDDFAYTIVEQHDTYLPHGFANINGWIDERQIARHRTSIRKLMDELGINNRKGFIDMVRCVSLTDTFWMRREDSGLCWEDVSLYSNSFVGLARALLTPSIRTKLINLKDFVYEDPGFGYPAWKLEIANRLKDQMIADILA